MSDGPDDADAPAQRLEAIRRAGEEAQDERPQPQSAAAAGHEDGGDADAPRTAAELERVAKIYPLPPSTGSTSVIAPQRAEPSCTYSADANRVRSPRPSASWLDCATPIGRMRTALFGDTLTPGGRPSPYLKIRSEAARTMASLATRLGLSPADRNGLKLGAPKDSGRWGGLIG